MTLKNLTHFINDTSGESTDHAPPPFSPEVVEAVAGELEGFSLSKGTIRFTPEKPLPEPVAERVIRLRLAEVTGS